MPARRTSMALPTSVDDDWQRVQAQIDAVVHENDEAKTEADAEPARERCAGSRRKADPREERDRR